MAKFSFYLLILIVAAYASLSLGYENYSPFTLWAMLNGDYQDVAYVVLELRWPRLCIAVIVGSSLAVAGALLQLLTRNPMVAPDILGFNAMAAALVVLCLWIVPEAPVWLLMLCALVGVMIASLVIAALNMASKEQQSMVKLPLIGVVFSLLASAVTQALLSLNEGTMEQALFWITGSIQGRELSLLYYCLPLVLLGFSLVLVLLPQLKLLQLDSQHAQSLGLSTKRLYRLLFIAITSLVAAAVVLAGPIAFIGLIVPQFSRLLVGYHIGKLLTACALLGASLLVFADVLARFLIYPEELPVGVVTAFIGAPLFIFLLTKRSKMLAG